MALWDRTKGESNKSFLKFCYYRDLGEKRHHIKVAQHFGCTQGTIRALADKWSWVERVRAWDDYQDKITQESLTGEIQKIRERQRMLAARMQMIGAKRLDDFINPETGEVSDDITPSVALKLQIEGARLERQSAGLDNKEPLSIVHEPIIFSDDLLITKLMEDLKLEWPGTYE
jgi:hypothetical protein